MVFLVFLSFLVKGNNVCNFADDETSYDCVSSLEEVIKNLGHDTNMYIEPFDCNYMAFSYDFLVLFICLGCFLILIFYFFVVF